MKPYPRYKPTGLAWLPAVPEHWEVVKLRNLVKQPLQYGANASGLFYDSEKPRYIRITDIDENGTLKTSGMQSLSWDDAQPYLLTDGDVLFARSGATVGKTFLFRSSFGNCCFAGYLIRCKPNRNRIAPEYLSYYSLSNNYKNWLNRSTIQATIQNVSAEKYKEMPLPVPPPSEQGRIVRYLDAKTAAIDELVRAKEREIELLRERKQALITAAVTGGLGPATERKDSGIPWIGKIPKHWAVAKTGHLFKMLLGKMLANSATSPKDTFERYACAKDVHFSGIDTSDLKEMWFSPEEKALLQTRQGDLLIVEGGAGAGGAAIVEDDGGYCIQNSIHLLRSQHELGWTPFLKYWMFSLVSRGYIDHVCNRATIPHFTKDKVFNMPFPLPPLPEQRRIVEHLDNVCSELDAAETAIRKQISLLQELRTRLVSDAVTGAVET